MALQWPILKVGVQPCSVEGYISWLHTATSCLTELTGAATAATIRTNTAVSAVSLVHTHEYYGKSSFSCMCWFVGLSALWKFRLCWNSYLVDWRRIYISMFIWCQSHFTCCVCVCVLVFLSVCGSLYVLLTGLPESEMPYHFYTDQRFALVLLCVFLILPLSIPKEISIQKYIRSGFWS